MGTPKISAACLGALIDAGHNICGVYTRADKAVGRKQVLSASPVKELALKHNIQVFQPVNLKSGAAAQIDELSPDIIVVVAYGRILGEDILAIPPHGCINLHVSLLPKYRGAAPIQWAIINGEKETGATVMLMDKGLDTGPVIAAVKVPIGENDTQGDVFERFEEIGAALLVKTLADIEAGGVVAVPQNDALATFAPPLSKEIAEINFAKSNKDVHNFVRGLNPWPTAFFISGAKKIKVLTTVTHAQNGTPGQVLSIKPLIIACGQGAVELVQLVPEGSRQMGGDEWAAGRRFKIGDNVLSN